MNKQIMIFEDSVHYISDNVQLAPLHLSFEIDEESNDSGIGCDTDSSFTISDDDLSQNSDQFDIENSSSDEDDYSGPKSNSTPVKRNRPVDWEDKYETPSKRSRCNEDGSENANFFGYDLRNELIRDVLTDNLDDNLVGDFSKAHRLPLIENGKHNDLKSISPETLSDLLNSKDVDSVDEIALVDCRYPYEYEGGHIAGAINIWEQQTMTSTFFGSNAMSSSSNTRPNIVIFHCEFSSERGPRMARFLREQDRKVNKENYPNLHYPEIYLLEGGYKSFYLQNKSHCEPDSYKPMDHPSHVSDLKLFRSKSKSLKCVKSEKRKPTSFRNLIY